MCKAAAGQAGRLGPAISVLTRRRPFLANGAPRRKASRTRRGQHRRPWCTAPDRVDDATIARDAEHGELNSTQDRIDCSELRER